MKFPYMRRCEYELHMADEKRRQQYAKAEHEREIHEMQCMLDEVLPRLVKIKVQHISEFGTYRICADFHRDMIERAFTHGDTSYLKYVAQGIGRDIARKIMQFNLARCERL